MTSEPTAVRSRLGFDLYEATSADFDRLLAFYELVDRDFYPPLSGRAPLTRTVTEALLLGEERSMIATDSSHETVAAATWQVRFEGKPDAVYLTFIAVHPSRRSSGVGAWFLSRLLSHVGEAGSTMMYTRTWSTNVEMLKLYRRLGFLVDRVVRDDRGPGVDSIYLSKSLRMESQADPS